VKVKRTSRIVPPLLRGPVILHANLGFHFLEKNPPRLPRIFSACKKQPAQPQRKYSEPSRMKQQIQKKQRKGFCVH
jgi:hypothetical protein